MRGAEQFKFLVPLPTGNRYKIGSGGRLRLGVKCMDVPKNIVGTAFCYVVECADIVCGE